MPLNPYNAFFDCLNMKLTRQFIMKMLHLIVSHVSVLLCFSLIPMPRGMGLPVMVHSMKHTHHNNETDTLALLAIRAQIMDPMHTMASWDTSFHFCDWKGVSCRKLHQRVTVLDLSSQNLAGSISPSIGNLSFLRVIDLSNNNFQEGIPHEIGRLFRLQELILANNSLGGPIPANISGCTDMRMLHLQNNNFTGKFPSELGFLSKLMKLYLGENSLTGSIPASLGNLSSLKEFDAGDNYLEGSIPESIGRFKTLNILYLDQNMISGSIPPSIFNLSYLARFSVANNTIGGSLPQDTFLSLPKLEAFLVWGNQLSGVIPISLSNASNLRSLDLSINNFFGGVHTNFGSLKNLSWLGLSETNLGNDLSFITSLTNCSHLRLFGASNSNFGGILPSAIANLSTTLEFLELGGNPISGEIPPGIGNLVRLTAVDLSYCQFTGALPETIGNLYNAHEIGFGGNKLSGRIPFSIGNLTLLNQLWLEKNNFEGSIPSSLGNCQSLLLLHLYDNALNGTIPREVIGLSSLTKSLNLSRNLLTGPLPLEVGNLKSLVKLDVSKNKLSGDIPSTLGGCTSLARLYMDGNSFVGIIPDSFSSLKGLEELDLAQNDLSGKILEDFSTFKFLWRLNLSFNDFEGEVPIRGVFSNASAILLTGNEKLCGGISELRLPACSKGKHRRQRISLVVKLAISLCGLLALSSVLVVSFMLIRRHRERKQSSSSVLRDPLLSVSYGDLLQATNGFSSENLIGMGNFGSVYRGILGQEQRAVAVKVLNLQNKRASKSFITECEALRNIRHRNLVKVITACSGINHNGDDFKALVYEFMPNGSLDAWLHSLPQTSNVQMEPGILTFVRRLNVAIDVATALDYLHNHCATPVIHCDIKPSNILLDNDMTAHVGDFGIAKIISQCNVEKSARSSSSSVGVKGTIGYAAPEYGMGSMATSQGDVYSFGILLLEIFTGKKPTDDIFKNDSNLHKFVKTALLGGAINIVFSAENPLFDREGNAEEAASSTVLELSPIELECLTSVLEIGVACSEESPRERMSISDAVNKLQAIKGLLLKKPTATTRSF